MALLSRKALLYTGLSIALLNLSGCDYMSKNFYHLKKDKTAEAPPLLNESSHINKKDIIVVNNAGSTNNSGITIEKVRSNAIALTKDMPAVPPPSVFADVEKPEEKPPVQLKIKPKRVVERPRQSPPKTQLEVASIDPERINELEQRVQKITDTLNKLSPAIIKLAGIENDLNSLTLQLSDLIEQNRNFDVTKQVEPVRGTAPVPKTEALIKPMPESITPDPSPKMPQIKAKMNVQEIQNASKMNELDNLSAKTVKAIEPAAGTFQQSNAPIIKSGMGKNIVYKIRTGDHKGKTRLVFETAKKLENTDIQIDNGEKIVLVNLGQTAMQANIDSLAKVSSLIHSASQLKNNTNGQTALVLDLHESTSLIASEYIAPGKGSQNHRLVIDLKR